MRIKASALLAVAFALPAVAQTAAQPRAEEAKVEKLWKIETSGISG
jgi:hypothetical protein